MGKVLFTSKSRSRCASTSITSRARLGVFMAIALHSNADGWARPSMAALKAETGYNVQTISQALSDFCALTIDGQRVLLNARYLSDRATVLTSNDRLEALPTRLHSRIAEQAQIIWMPISDYRQLRAGN